MIDMSPTMYLEWLLNTGKYREYQAIQHVEQLYKRQHGIGIKIYQRLYRGSLIWDYEYEK